jgi:hypothetical protein
VQSRLGAEVRHTLSVFPAMDRGVKGCSNFSSPVPQVAASSCLDGDSCDTVNMEDPSPFGVMKELLSASQEACNGYAKAGPVSGSPVQLGNASVGRSGECRLGPTGLGLEHSLAMCNACVGRSGESPLGPAGLGLEHSLARGPDPPGSAAPPAAGLV